MNDDDNHDKTVPAHSVPPFSSGTCGQGGQLLQSGIMLPPQTPGVLGVIGKYQVIKILGEGGMGQVVLAREPVTDSMVAIKLIKPEFLNKQWAVHRFLTEARHMFRMSHGAIIRVLDVSDRPEGPYFVMPFMNGGSLAEKIKPGEGLPPETILPVARSVAEALHHAHTRGITHRDLKPTNILLDAEGKAYLADFGLLRTFFNDSIVDASQPQLEGTVPYMSPAVAAGKAEDTRCDIYAFGCLLYEMLTGQPPYQGPTVDAVLKQIQDGPPPPVRQLNPYAPAALTAIADHAMARELRDRYASMGDVVAELERVAQGKEPLGTHGREKTSGSNKKKILAAGIAAAIVLAAAGVWRFSGNKLDRAEDVSKNATPSATTLTTAGETKLGSGKTLANAQGGKDPQSMPEKASIDPAPEHPPGQKKEIEVFRDNDPLPEGDAVISYVMTLKHASPSDALRAISLIIGQVSVNGSIVALQDSVVITEHTSVIRRLIKLKEEIDKNPEAPDAAPRVYRPVSSSTTGGRKAAPPQAGVGALLQEQNGALVMGRVWPGGSAAEAGLKRGTILQSIGGESTGKMQVQDASAAIRGPIGSKVKLVVTTPEGATRELELVRAEPKEPVVSSRKLDHATGLIVVPGFVIDTCAAVEGALQEFSNIGIKNIVLDLRNNGGGSIQSAAGVAGLLLGKQSPAYMYREEGRSNSEPKFSTKPKAWTGGVVVLVDGGTASAAEVVAAACRADKRGKIVGETTCGKGSVYQPFSLPNGDMKKVRIGELRTADDQPIEGVGMKPDVEFTGSDEELLVKAISSFQTS